MSIQLLVDPWRDYLKMTGRSKATADSYHSDVRIMFERTDPTAFEDDFAAACNRYVALRRDEGMAASSIRRVMSAIRSFYEYAKKQGRDLTEPFDDYRPPKAVKPMAHPLPGGNSGMDSVDAMLRNAWKPQHRALVALCGYAGLRVHEALAITPRSLAEHTDGWWLTVFGKGGVYREVPVSNPLLQVLLDQPEPPTPDTPYVEMSDRGARKAITTIGKRAQVGRPVASHDLRHTFATYVHNKTQDLRVTQELMGHSSSKTTEGYTQVDQRTMREAIT